MSSTHQAILNKNALRRWLACTAFALSVFVPDTCWADQNTGSIAGPPAALDYAQDTGVKIRFSTYREREFPGDTNPGAPKLLNVPQLDGWDYPERLEKIDADEGFVYVPGEVVLIHVTAGDTQTIVIRGLHSGRTFTERVYGKKTIPFVLDPPGGKDDFELYEVESRQGDHVFARRCFLSILPTGDVKDMRDVFGRVGWEFIEWHYSPFDIVCGFPEARENHPPLSGRFDSRLQPWNWVTEVYTPDLEKNRVRVPDGSKDWLAQPYTEWARWYQYFGADLSSWKPESWRWGEFYNGEFTYHQYDAHDGKPGITLQGYSYIAANDSIMPNGMYFREWLGQIYYAATKQALAMSPGEKAHIAEADHWNDNDMGLAPTNPRILEAYVDYVKAKGLPHDDLDKAKNSAELADLVLKSGTEDRRTHYNAWNTFQVNLRGRQYIWEDAVKATMEVQGAKKVDWLYGNGMVGDAIDSFGMGDTNGVGKDFEHRVKPWARFEPQSDWDYMHWMGGSYRFAGQAPARVYAMLGQRIYDPDVYNEKVPHADPASRTDDMFKKWCTPQNAAEHNRMFTYTSFIHYYDAQGHPQRLVNLNYNNVWRQSQDNSLGVLTPQTPGDEAHAILDHRQVSEGITMEQPIGYVGVVSSPKAADLAHKTDYVVNHESWPWYFETLVDQGISLPAFIDSGSISTLPANTNLIFAPHREGTDDLVISARINGQMITAPWAPKDRAALADFVSRIKAAAGDPVKFSDGTTGFAYTFRGNRALVFVENMRSPTVSESPQEPRPADANEQARTAEVDIALPFSAEGAQVWDLTSFLPVTDVQASNGRLTFKSKMRAGDGRLYAIVPPGPAVARVASSATPTAAQAQLNQLEVPWEKTDHDTVSYRNALFLDKPQPYGARNYTQLNDVGAPPAQVPARATAAYDGSLALNGDSPLFKLIALSAVVVVGKDAPASIQNAAKALADAVKKQGGSGKLYTAEDFDAMPVSETGTYHVLAVGTIWDNEMMQRFNDPWAIDRDFSYGRLGNQPAWAWMPHTGFNVGWVGDFGSKDPSVGYLSVDRSSLMWEQRCKIFDDKNPPEKQMPLRFFFRISGSGPEGVAKAVKAFADQGLLNGCLPGANVPKGDPRFNLTPDRIVTSLPIEVPQKVDAGSGHTLAYLGWNQADGEQYDGFFSKTGVEAKRIVRAKYVPEWGMTNFLSSPHRASTRFELCVVDVADAAGAQKAAAQMAGTDGSSVTLADGTVAQQTKLGTLIAVRGNAVVLESAPQPWGKSLMEAYLAKK